MSTTTQEHQRVSAMLSGLSFSYPIMLMTPGVVSDIESGAVSDPVLATLNNELCARLGAVQRPQDHPQMAQAYEVYAEASVYMALTARGVPLARTPGTGGDRQKRPDFVHAHPSGNLYFEVKALEIASPLARHDEMADDALERSAELDGRVRAATSPAVHMAEPLVVSGHKAGSTPDERIDLTIRRIMNTIKPDQLRYGPTVLVVDLGRLSGIHFGPSVLSPVFFHDEEPARACVSGELWQIALGHPGERIFVLPEFDGRSNLGGHQAMPGVLVQQRDLLAITFFLPGLSVPDELLTIWNIDADLTGLQNPCTLSEAEIGDVLGRYSSGLNDDRNELGCDYAIMPKRP